MTRAAPLFLAGVALLAFGCSKDDRKPVSCDVMYLDSSGGCGRGAVAGTLELTEGGPEARTTVTLVGEGTDAFGDSGDGARSFALGRIPPGGYTLVAHAPGYVSRTVEGVRVAAGETTDVGTILLDREGDRTPAIAGTIRLRGATDHRGTLVHLDDSTMVTATAEDGSFRIDDVEPGPHVLHARHQGYEPIDTGLLVPERDELQVNFEMVPVAAPGTLAGVVLEATTRAPLQGVTIRVGETHGAATGADGSYSVNVPSGTYQVRVGLAGFEPSSFEGITIVPGETTTLDVELEPVFVPASLHGVARRMHSALGTDAGIVVSVVGTEATAVTKPDGSWSIDAIEAGLYDLEFTDEFMPPALVAGVPVAESIRNPVPEVVLGPARRIAAEASASARVFPANRKALVAFQGQPGTYLFDPATDELTQVADESLEAIAVDPDERYATLLGAGSLHRLDIETGAIEPISAPAVGSLLSDRAVTLFVGDDDRLYVLLAGDLEAAPRGQVYGRSTLSISQTIDSELGLAMVAVKDGSYVLGEIPVDFGGWAGPYGDRFAGPSPEVMAMFGYGAGEEEGWRLHWVNVAARTAQIVSTTRTPPGRSSSDGQALLFPHDLLVNMSWSISALDLGTGDVTPLEADVEYDFTSFYGRMVAKRGGEILWMTSNPPASGVLCGAPSVQISDFLPFYGCLGGASPRALRVFDLAFGEVLTYSTNAAAPTMNSWGLVTWTEPPTTTLQVRLVGSETGLTIACPGATFARLTGNQRSSVLANCSNGSAYLLDFVAGGVHALPQGTYFCSHSSERDLAVCSYPCSGESCLVLYDTALHGWTPVTSSPSAAITTAWGSDRSVAIRTGTGAAFHGRAGQPGDRPKVVDCGLDGVKPAAAEADYSLWYDDGWVGTICSRDGTLSIPFAMWSTGVIRIGSSKKYFIGGWLVDLEDGSHTQLIRARPTAVASADGLLVASDEGLLRISEEGDVEWIVTGRRVTRRADFAGRTAFMVTRDSNYDLLVADPDGAVRTLVEDVSDVRHFPGRDLFFHDADGRSAALTVVDTGDAIAWPLPQRIRPTDPWLLEGDRLFFDTPVEGGVAFATANLSERTVALLHETSGGHALGADGTGRWLFVAKGWTWQETAEAPRAVIAGETTRMESGADGMTIFQAISPNVVYWLDSE